MEAAKPVTPAEQRLGFATEAHVNPVTDTVATTATEILRNNPERLFWLIVNLSLNKGYIGWDPQVSSSRGVPIGPSGGFISASIEEDGELVIQPVYAVNENAEGTYYIVEVVRR